MGSRNEQGGKKMHFTPLKFVVESLESANRNLVFI